MSTNIYNKAFAVELSHEFYSGVNKSKVNNDLSISPTIESVETFRRGRMRFVHNAKGVILFYQAYKDSSNNQQPVISLSDNTEFVFSLKMDPVAIAQFMNVTDLVVSGKKFTPGKVYMLNGTASNSDPDAVVDLSPSIIDELRPSVFSYEFKSSAPSYIDPAKVTVKRGTDVIFIFPSVIINPETKIFSVPLDFTGKPKGLYTVTAEKTVGSGVINTADIYVDNDLAKESIFGIIKIKYPDASYLYKSKTIKTDFQTFQYEFPVRTDKWRYFVVVRSVDANTFFPANHLEILDSNTGSPLTFTPENPPGLPDPDYTIDGKKVVVFTSSAPSSGDIAFSDQPVSTLELWQKGATDKLLISGLPNAQNAGVDSNRLDPSDYANVFAEIFIPF